MKRIAEAVIATLGLFAVLFVMLFGAVAVCCIVPAISYFFGVGVD